MILLRVLLILLLPALAQGAAGAATGGLGEVFRLLAGLGLVLGLLLLVYALSRRGGKWLPGNRGGAIRIVEARHLGPRKGLYLVEVRGEELLLGVGSDRIDLLCRLGKGDTESFEQALRTELDGRS